jgi:hypothetical protein
VEVVERRIGVEFGMGLTLIGTVEFPHCIVEWVYELIDYIPPVLQYVS